MISSTDDALVITVIEIHERSMSGPGLRLSHQPQISNNEGEGVWCWIWRILANGSEISLSDETILEIVKRNPRLTGRDVKNLLKLARLTKPPITADIIDFVKRFKPTSDQT